VLAYLDAAHGGTPGTSAQEGMPAAGPHRGEVSGWRGRPEVLPSRAWRSLSPEALSPEALSPGALSPEAWQSLRYAMARLAVELVSGPGGLASALRRGLLDAPYNSRSVVLDIGYSDTIPGPVRRAVQLRARHCEWPGCDKPLAWCDIHHLRHKRDGGPTSVTGCAALCQFHHDTCIHRWGWRLSLHPDATTTAYGPKGQVIHSHGPPGQGPPGTG
jgi:hypothetical protein